MGISRPVFTIASCLRPAVCTTTVCTRYRVI